MSRPRFTERARSDLIEIALYWKVWSASKSKRVLEEIRKKSNLVAKQPCIGRDRSDFGPGYRSVVAGDYLVIYTSGPGGIIVRRVLHGARDITRSDFGS
jgi:plasmid stabilization system protein ParE